MRASSVRPRSVRSPQRANTSALSATREKSVWKEPGEVLLQCRSPTAATLTAPFMASAPRRACYVVEELGELGRVERLDEMVVEAGRPRLRAVGLFAPSGDGDQADAAAPRLLPQLLRHLMPVHLGQADIEQDDVGPELLRHLER